MALNTFTIQEPDGDQREVPINLVAGVSYPPVQMVFGDPTADEAFFVDEANPLPVTISSGFPATFAVTQGTSPWVIGDGGLSLTVDGPLTDVELRASPVPVTGPLTDTELRASAVPVSGPLTDAELRASAVTVTGSFTFGSPQHVIVDSGFPASQAVTGPLTDTELRASAVPVTIPHQTNQTGTWGYTSGTSGTATLTGSKRVLQITATALEAAATITINGGDTITLPYGSTDKVSTAITIEPKGNLVDPTVIFTGTDSYFIEHVVV